MEIPEDAPPGAAVASVRAVDRDSGVLGTEGVRYTRISGPMAAFLHLDERTGKCVLLSLIDLHQYSAHRYAAFRHLAVALSDSLSKGLIL